MKGKRHDIMGDFSLEDMYAYVEQLYVHKDAKEMIENQPEMQTKEPLTLKATLKGIQKLESGKAIDTNNMSSEMLKWSGKTAKEWIHKLLNQAVTQGLPVDWQENWIKHYTQEEARTNSLITISL